MKRHTIPAALFVFAMALPATAEQFAVQIDAAYEGASPKLKEALKVYEVESFSANGSHYVVLDAPNEAYVEAFFFAINREAIELNVVDADWTNTTMQHLSLAQRLGFLRAINCNFCTS